ncbi:NACHT, LRR and PYD domains-containing protein 12-like, partial [Triplophysa dalaica]
MGSVKELLKNSLNDLRKEQLKEFQWHLKNDYKVPVSHLEKADVLDTVDRMVQSYEPEDAVKITRKILMKINQNQLAKDLKEGAAAVYRKAVYDDCEFSNRLKKDLKQKYERILEGNSEKSLQNTYLNNIYTDLYIVKNQTGGVENEHEVRQIELNQSTAAEDASVKCNDIFKVQRDTGEQNRKVLTLGIAGVGKTVSVSKFILDWAEGKENQEIIFIFPLSFRELNLIQEEYSLMELIHEYFSCTKQLSLLPKEEDKVMFIFDGLDECRFPLSFEKSKRFTDVHKKTTVDVIITNLIERNLLPSALIWITSRPAAAHLIPRRHIDQVTEIRGFNDEQKKVYFTRNSKPDMSERIISHIKRSRSLHIMCHIPVFCWICLCVLQPLMTQENLQSIPTTLTGMYIYFLLNQMKQMKAKKQSASLAQSFEDVVLKLGELAFTQLQKGNLIFYKEDLKECGLEVDDGVVFSGLCTQMFQAEKPVSGRKVYSFVHLSVQEFLAALYVLLIYKNTKTNPFLLSWTEKLKGIFMKKSLFNLHKCAVNSALQSKNGHLDLLLLFLMGLSLESNQNELKELMPSLNITAEDMKHTADYIKMKIHHDVSSEKSTNLFHCLNELKDDSLITEIQKYLNSDGLSAQDLSPVQWSALVFVLMMSEETREMFEMQKYRRSDEAVIRLLPVIRNTRRALLQNCNLTDECCESLSSCLQSSTSLRELDLSNNDLKDSGVRLISDALKTHNCQLHTLRLSGCMVTDEGCCYLASALSSNPSHLRELDLSYNHPQHSALQLLSDKLKDPNYTLNKLNVDHGGEFRVTAGLHKYNCDLTLDLNTTNTRLKLSEENRRITHVDEDQSYPGHPDRFEGVPQVLCRESLTGRCYWEVEWSGSDVLMSVSYKSISRKASSEDSMFGYNAKSWSLHCSHNRITAWHNNNKTVICVSSPLFNRVGVYVDQPAGSLSFYSVSDTQTLTLLHTYYTTFTEPPCAGFTVFRNSLINLCNTHRHKRTHTHKDTHTHTMAVHTTFTETLCAGFTVLCNSLINLCNTHRHKRT